MYLGERLETSVVIVDQSDILYEELSIDPKIGDVFQRENIFRMVQQ